MNTYTSKPFTVPADDAPAETFIKVYWRLIQSDPRWLHGLRRPDGSLYLPRGTRANTTDYTKSTGSKVRAS